MRKICLVNPTIFLKRPIAELISRLNNFEVNLFNPVDIIKGSLDIHYNKFKKIKIHKIYTINFPFLSFEWPIPINPLFIVKIIKILKNNDIIHLWVPFYPINLLIAIFKRLFFNSKKLYLTMDTFPSLSFKFNSKLDSIFRVFYKTLGKLIFSITEKINLYSPNMKKIAVKAGITMDKILIFPTGIDIKIKEKEKSIRNEYNIKKNEKIILFIGILNDRKGVDVFIKVAKRLKDYNIKFIIVGDGSKRKEYEKLAERYGLLEKFIFTGFRHDVHNFYHEADLLLLPSKGEGLPGVIMESMIYGVPVVSSNILGVKDLIQNKENGFLCEIENIDCFVKNVILILNDKKLREKFIANSIKKIKSEYNWDNNIENYKRLYNL